MNIQQCKLTVVILAFVSVGLVVLTPRTSASSGNDALDEQLSAVLSQHGFTGRVGFSLEQRLGRKIDKQLAGLGRLAFHDSLLGLNDDNSCSGCHSAPLGFGDPQSIAIGVENNNVVGRDRTGPRNQRRTPIILNNVFYPALMWNSRFNSVSGNPFDNSAGFQFPLPEGFSLSLTANSRGLATRPPGTTISRAPTMMVMNFYIVRRARDSST